MKALAQSIISTAAQSTGMAADSVMIAPDKQTILLPTPRLEISWMPETLKRSFRRLSAATYDATPEYRTLRSRIFTREMSVRAEIRSDDDDYIESFMAAFLVALPHKTSDGDGNLVTVTAARAVRSGFETKTVEVFRKVSNAIYLTFTGMLFRDDQLPLIRDINIVDGVTYEEQNNGE